MKYFGSSQHQYTPENTVCSSGTCALSGCENEIFQQLLVPEYFREYCFAFRLICSLNTHENNIGSWGEISVAAVRLAANQLAETAAFAGSGLWLFES